MRRERDTLWAQLIDAIIFRDFTSVQELADEMTPIDRTPGRGLHGIARKHRDVPRLHQLGHITQPRSAEAFGESTMCRRLASQRREQHLHEELPVAQGLNQADQRGTRQHDGRAVLELDV